MEKKELNLEVGKRYLLKSKRHSSYIQLIEVSILEISEKAVKYNNITANSIIWWDKESLCTGWEIYDELVRSANIPLIVTNPYYGIVEIGTDHRTITSTM